MARQDFEAVGKALDAASGRTRSLEAFGQGVAQQILAEAAKRAGEAKDGSIPVALNFEVRVRAALPTVPGPEGIDVCWEIRPAPGQPFLDCYVECEFTPPTAPVVLPRDVTTSGVSSMPRRRA